MVWKCGSDPLHIGPEYDKLLVSHLRAGERMELKFDDKGLIPAIV